MAQERPIVVLPKFGSWDVNDPSAGESYTMIFSQARQEKQSGGSNSAPVSHMDPHGKAIRGDSQKLPKDIHHDHQRSSIWACCFRPKSD